jgi:hypothetical protein
MNIHPKGGRHFKVHPVLQGLILSVNTKKKCVGEGGEYIQLLMVSKSFT